MRIASTAAVVAVLGALLCHCSSDPGGPPPQGGGSDSGTRPPASAGHDLVYDDALGRVLLVNAGLGAATGPGATQPTQVWAWNGSEWRVIDSSGPPIRSLAGVAYDRGRGVLVVFGGGDPSSNALRDDTWELDATGWRRVDPR